MSRPMRIQLSRAKGWRMPPNTTKVDRTSRWGNPYRLDDDNQPWSRFPWGSRERARALVDHYERAIAEGFVLVPYTSLTPAERGDGYHSTGAHRVAQVAPKYLRGQNLGCWCRLCERHADGKPLGEECPDCMPCHADVIGRLANPESDVPEGGTGLTPE